MRRWDSASSARVTRHPVGCQTSDKMELPPRLDHAPLSRHPASRRHRSVGARVRPGLNVLTGETGAGKSILVGAVGLLVGGRASADLVRTGEDIGHHRSRLRDARRRARSSSGARCRLRAAAARSSMARSSRAPRCASSPARSSTCTASTSIRCCSIPRRISTCSTPTPSSHAERARGGASVRAPGSRCATSATGSLASAARERVARGVPRLPARRDRPRRAASRAKTTSSRHARQVLANADKLQRLCAEAYQALYEGDQAALASARRRVAQSRRARGDRRALRAARRRPGRRQVAARGSRVLPALVRRRHRRAARRGCRRSRTGWRRSSV